MSSMYLDDLKMLLNKYKFVGLTHSETKQTKMLEFGAEKELLQESQTSRRVSGRHF